MKICTITFRKFKYKFFLNYKSKYIRRCFRNGEYKYKFKLKIGDPSDYGRRYVFDLYYFYLIFFKIEKNIDTYQKFMANIPPKK